MLSQPFAGTAKEPAVQPGRQVAHDCTSPTSHCQRHAKGETASGIQKAAHLSGSHNRLVHTWQRDRKEELKQEGKVAASVWESWQLCTRDFCWVNPDKGLQ